MVFVVCIYNVNSLIGQAKGPGYFTLTMLHLLHATGLKLHAHEVDVELFMSVAADLTGI